VKQIYTQADAICSLREQLNTTQDQLKVLRHDLHQARMEAASRHQVAAASAEKLFAQRVEIEERLRQELKHKDALQTQIASLQKELSRLKMSLKSAKVEVTKRGSSPSLSDRTESPSPAVSLDRKRETSTSPASTRSTVSLKATARAVVISSSVNDEIETANAYDEDLGSNKTPSPSASSEETCSSKLSPSSSPQREDVSDDNVGDPSRMEDRESSEDSGTSHLSMLVISLRADLVNLKADLAEARAERLSSEQAKSELDAKSRAESDAMKDKVDTLRRQMSKYKLKADQTNQWREMERLDLLAQVESLKRKIEDSKIDADQQSEANKRLQAELLKTRQEADKLRKQVADFIKELDEVKRPLQDKVKNKEAETRNLRQHVSLMQQKLADTNAEIVAQAAEHLLERQRLERLLSLARQEAISLQGIVQTMDDKVTRSEQHRDGKLYGESGSNDDEEDEGRQRTVSQIMKYVNKRL